MVGCVLLSSMFYAYHYFFLAFFSLVCCCCFFSVLHILYSVSCKHYLLLHLPYRQSIKMKCKKTREKDESRRLSVFWNIGEQDESAKEKRSKEICTMGVNNIANTHTIYVTPCVCECWMSSKSFNASINIFIRLLRFIITDDGIGLHTKWIKETTTPNAMLLATVRWITARNAVVNIPIRFRWDVKEIVPIEDIDVSCVFEWDLSSYLLGWYCIRVRHASIIISL